MFRITSDSESNPGPVLIPGRPANSLEVTDYTFGLTEDMIKSYTNMADVLHAALLARYGIRSLTPYLMKIIDFIPAFLKVSDVKSLMR